jgi:hypothetical protein
MDSENKMTLYEVVTKLIGQVNPIGETSEDNRRFNNLKIMTELTTLLLKDIDEVATAKNRYEYSMKRAGEFASKYLTNDLGIVE